MAPRRRRRLVATVVAGVLLLVLGVSAGVWWASSRTDESSSAGAPTRAPEGADAITPTPSEGSPEPSATAGTPSGSSASAAQRDDLRLDVAQVNQPCSGGYVVILASTGEPKDYRATLTPALAASATASYLVTTESCSAFNQYVDGNPIYAAYDGPYTSLTEACQGRGASAYPGAYVRQLDAASDGRVLCSCNERPELLPDLSRDNAEEADAATAYVVADVQNLLSRAGFNPGGLVGGTYGPQTTRWVRGLQRREYLSTTGRTDPATWEAILRWCR